MHFSSPMIRLLPLLASGFLTLVSPAAAQDDAQGKPVTPADSYRVLMENERMRMIEVHIKPHSKVNVNSPLNRERFLYMLSDGALILAPPGKTPYEFAMHAGETAVFPAVSPTVENDTDSAVRALMVEVKQPMRTEAVSVSRGKLGGKHAVKHATKSKTHSKTVARAKPKAKRSTASTSTSANAPLNLRKANAKPARNVSRKSKGANG